MRKKLKRVTALILALSLIITAVKVSSSVFADTEIFYASDFVNNPNGGYLNATFEYGEYPQSEVSDATGFPISPSDKDIYTDPNTNEKYMFRSKNNK